MKRTARFFSAWMAVFLFFTGYGLAQPPMPISPGANDDSAIVMSGCPTFSWTEVADATAYRVAVFEPDELAAPLSHDDMVLLKTPVLEKTIPDRGFSWAPSANRGLCGGTYVWYVAAVNTENAVEWSKGKMFKVDALAGFEAAAGKCPASVFEAGSDEEGDQKSESPSSTGEDGSGALSLEQVISSKVTREQLWAIEGNNQESGGNPSQEAVIMGEEGTSNTLYGHEAGNSLIDNRTATFIGAEAGYSNTTGRHNTFIGHSVGYHNTSGSDNTFLGRSAGYLNTTGGENTFIGGEAGYSNTTGDSNTFLGRYAGYSNTTGYENVFTGQYAGFSNTTGYANTYLGSSAGYSNTAGFTNTFIGYRAGYYNTTGVSNTFIGSSAGHYNTTGYYNTFIGRRAGYSNTTGESNTFLGYSAGQVNTTGESNTFIGYHAGYSNTTGDSNTFIGRRAGYPNTTGDSNTFIGHYTGQSNTTGRWNTFVGNTAGNFNTTGKYNTFIGPNAGHDNTTGIGNVFIGNEAGYNNGEGSNKLYIDNSGTDTPLIYGEFDNNIVKIHGQLLMLSAATSSDRKLKKDIQPLNSSLDKVVALQGVSYHWKTAQYQDWGFKDTKQIGLVAQDVEAVIPELVSTDTKGYKAVSYNKLTAVLVEAVKELKAENDKLKAQLREKTAQQQSQIDELRAVIKGLKG